MPSSNAATATLNAPAPESPSVPKKRPRRPTPDGYVTQREGMLVLNTSYHAFLRAVEEAGVRTRRLPGQKSAKFNLEDLQRVARESVHVGLPKPPASA